MNKIILAIFVLAVVNLWGCDGEINLTPTFDGESFSAETYDGFEGFPEGIATVYRLGDGFYTCNPADNFVYGFTGGAVLNLDSTQVICTTDTFFHTDLAIDSRPVAAAP